MKPPQQEIDKTIVNLAKENKQVSNSYANSFVLGFNMAIEWLLNWQKSQPLEVFLVMENPESIATVCRTQEKAEETVLLFEKTYKKSFYVEKSII